MAWVLGAVQVVDGDEGGDEGRVHLEVGVLAVVVCSERAGPEEGCA